MITMRPASPAAMAARHQAKAKRTRPAAERTPRPANVQAVFALGDEEFITFRGRAYGVPPVPLPAGQRLLETYVAAIDAARRMAGLASVGETDPELTAEYFAALGKLPGQLWALTREPSRFRRLLRAIGLRPNPFRSANEAELLDLAHFFYRRRTRSGVRYRPTRPGAVPIS